MTSSRKALAFAFVAVFGLYGCAKGPVAQPNAERAAHEKLQRLEAEHQSTVAARDQFRQKLLTAEQQNAQTRKELEQFRKDLEQFRLASAREKTDLTQQLKARTSERDTVQVQYEGFRKNIKELIGQAEAALPSSQPASLAKAIPEKASNPRN